MVEKGQQYKHHKGNIYQVLAVSEHTETGEKFVVYFNINIPDRIWSRPYDMFVENIPDGRKRFELIG